jgi:hypothetical protein
MKIENILIRYGWMRFIRTWVRTLEELAQGMLWVLLWVV